MTDTSAEILRLRAEVQRLEAALLVINDAAFGIAGILSRAIVDADVLGRDELADLIERRAGAPGRDDHNAPLLAFARAVRMNFPGGRFEVIDGGRSPEVDPKAG